MLKIVYMGTPDFAVGPLEAIYHSKHEIAAVVTAPDKPAGRGRKLSESDVKKFAEANDLPLLQPVNLKDSAFINIIKGINPDVIVVIAFRMLPKAIWSIPAKGTINLHASLLPQYRGAAPINWAIINGEKTSGLTTFFINESIDTGDILLQKPMDISETDTFGLLHDRMKEAGKEVILQSLEMIGTGSWSSVPQSQLSEELRPAPKLNRENTRIDWSTDAMSIFNKIRGLSPYPGAWTTLTDAQNTEHLIKITEVEYSSETRSESIGSISSDLKTQLMIQSGVGMIKVNKLQLSGRSAMTTAEFLRGYATLLQGAVFK